MYRIIIVKVKSGCQLTIPLGLEKSLQLKGLVSSSYEPSSSFNLISTNL